MENVNGAVDVFVIGDAMTVNTAVTLQKHGVSCAFWGKHTREPVVTDKIRDSLKKSKVLLLSGCMLSDRAQADFVIEAAKYAKSKKTYVMLDASPVIGKADPALVRAMLTHTDVILSNLPALEMLTEAAELPVRLQELNQYVPCIALKMGSRGSMVSIEPGFLLPDGSVMKYKTQCHVEAAPAVVDAAGAGAFFNAGFIVSFLRRESPDLWISLGNVLAHRAISFHF